MRVNLPAVAGSREGRRPSGIPLAVKLTEAERAINDTNKRWAAQSRVGWRAHEEAAIPEEVNA